MISNPPRNVHEYLALRSTTSARFWSIPPTEDMPFWVYIIEDERGMSTFDDSPQGSHPTTNPEMIHLLKFKVYLNKTEQCGL